MTLEKAIKFGKPIYRTSWHDEFPEDYFMLDENGFLYDCPSGEKNYMLLLSDILADDWEIKE